LCGVSHILGLIPDPVFQEFVHGPAGRDEIDGAAQIARQARSFSAYAGPVEDKRRPA
jgi:hypothetical protein